MIMYQAKFCNIVGSDGNIYIAGLQYKLRNPSSGESLQLPLIGNDPSTFSAGQQYTCYDYTLDSAVSKWYLGKRTYLSTGFSGIDAIQFLSKLGTNYNNHYIFNQINEGITNQQVTGTAILIGSYGTYQSQIFDSVNWVFWNTACTCADTDILPATLTNMITSTVTGDQATQALPTLQTQYEKFGKGSCGTYVKSLTKSDGSSCASFLTISGSNIVLKTSDGTLAGSHQVKFTSYLASYPSVKIEISFTVTIIDLKVVSGWQTYYEQPFNTPSVTITPACTVNPTAGYSIVYAIDSTPANFLTVNSDLSVTMPSADKADEGTTFAVDFSCTVPELAGKIKKLSFTATAKLLKEILLTVVPGWQTTYDQAYNTASLVIQPQCQISEAGYTIIYSIENLPLPSFVTVNAEKSVTLPSADKANENASFNIIFGCESPELAGIVAKTTFTATATLQPEIILSVKQGWQTTYQQVFGDPSIVIVPECEISEPGHTIVYSIANLPLPSYVTVNSDNSVTLPSADKANEKKSFQIVFGCIVPELTDVVGKILFTADATLLAEVIPPDPVDPVDPDKKDCNVENCDSDEDKKKDDLSESTKQDEQEVKNYNLYPYYIITGQGPYLRNAYFDNTETKTLFKVLPGESFDWTYEYGDRQSKDVHNWEWALYNQTSTEAQRLNVTLNLQQVQFFVFGEINTRTRQIRIGLKDNAYNYISLAGTYEIQVKIKNFLNQTSFTSIQIELEQQGSEQPIPLPNPAFEEDDTITPQISEDTLQSIQIVSYALTGILAIAFLLSFGINMLIGSAFCQSVGDRPKFKELWQTWEVWQMVSYLHLLGAPVAGPALVFIKPVFNLVNFDIIKVVPKLKTMWMKVFSSPNDTHQGKILAAANAFTSDIQTDGSLGSNFSALDLNSFYFIKNAASLVALFVPVFVVMFILSISSIAIRSLRQRCNQDDWYVLFKTVMFMQFGISALIMISQLPESGWQSALSILSIVMCFIIVPAYCAIRAWLLHKLPGRQLISAIQRALTIITLVCMHSHPSYQVFVLYTIQMVALACNFVPLRWELWWWQKQDWSLPVSTRQKEWTQNEKWRWSELQYSWSYIFPQAIFPILVISIKFDEQGFVTLALSGSLLAFTAVKNLILDDFVYKISLLKRRRLQLHPQKQEVPQANEVKQEDELRKPKFIEDTPSESQLRRKMASSLQQRKPWLKVDAISEEESQGKTSNDATPRGVPVINELLLAGELHDPTDEVTNTLPLESQAVLISQDDDEGPLPDGGWKTTPFAALFTGKRKPLRTKHQVEQADGNQPEQSRQNRVGSLGTFTSEEEQNQPSPRKNIHYIRCKQEQNGNNLIIKRDGENLGDLNFKGPIQNISLNENRELEISFGVRDKINENDSKLYDSLGRFKQEVLKVPLGGIDSDESIEINIDIDWPCSQKQADVQKAEEQKEITDALPRLALIEEQKDLPNPELEMQEGQKEFPDHSPEFVQPEEQKEQPEPQPKLVLLEELVNESLERDALILSSDFNVNATPQSEPEVVLRKYATLSHDDTPIELPVSDFKSEVQEVEEIQVKLTLNDDIGNSTFGRDQNYQLPKIIQSGLVSPNSDLDSNIMSYFEESNHRSNKLPAQVKVDLPFGVRKKMDNQFVSKTEENGSKGRPKGIGIRSNTLMNSAMTQLQSPQGGLLLPTIAFGKKNETGNHRPVSPYSVRSPTESGYRAASEQ